LDDQARLAALTSALEAEFPGLIILSKGRVWHQGWLGRFLAIITLGKQASYLDSYTTTLGVRRVYTPRCWESLSPAARYVVLRHEREHLRQFRRYTFLGMALLYVLLPLPVGLSYFRYRFERAGYEETIRASREVFGRAHVLEPTFQAGIVRQFTSGSYGWMWPFPRAVRRWVRAVAEEEA